MSFFEVIGIIKRKALIKELAAVYHAECLAYCQELMELQRKWEEVRNSNALLFLFCIYIIQYFSLVSNLDVFLYCNWCEKFLLDN